MTIQSKAEKRKKKTKRTKKQKGKGKTPHYFKRHNSRVVKGTYLACRFDFRCWPSDGLRIDGSRALQPENSVRGVGGWAPPPPDMDSLSMVLMLGWVRAYAARAVRSCRSFPIINGRWVGPSRFGHRRHKWIGPSPRNMGSGPFMWRRRFDLGTTGTR